MAAESCSACGCVIQAGKTESGPAVTFSGKTYCAECAALILPPEEIAKLTRPGKTQPVKQMPPRVGVLAPDDDVFGEAEPTKKHAATAAAALSAAAPPLAAPPVPKAAVRPPGTKSTGVQSSRRTSVVSGVKARKLTGAPGVSPGREERSGRETGRMRKRGADSMGLYVVIGAVILVVALGCYFAFSGGTAKKPVVKKAPVETNEDKTSSTEYARRAEAFHDKKDSKNEVENWSKAAAKAEKENNFDQAKVYQMKSINAVKSSKLSDK